MLLLNLSDSSKDYANSLHMHLNGLLSVPFIRYSISMHSSFILLVISHVQHLSSLGATQSIVLIKNYTVFQNDTPAIFYCSGSDFENGAAVVVWILNGTGYGLNHAQRGIRVVTDTPTGDTVSSRLFIPSNSAINNNTEVTCKTIDSVSNIVLTSEPANLTLQGECCNNITRMCTL